MENRAIIFFLVILVGAIYHLIRDILQIAGIENVFTEIGHWSHGWCGSYCNYVTLPLDIFVVTASAIVIRRNRFGVLGISIIATLFIGLFMWLWK